MKAARFLLRSVFGLALVAFAPADGGDETTAAAPPQEPAQAAPDSLGRPEITVPAFWDKEIPRERTVDPADPFAGGGGVSAVAAEPVQDSGHGKLKLSPGPASPLRIKQITFRVPRDKARALEAAGRRADEATLSNTLDGWADDGEVEITADFEFRAAGGRVAGQEARQEFIYPTEFEPDAELGIVSPTAFDTRNLGTVCSLIPRVRDHAVLAEVMVQRVRWAGFSGWVALGPHKAADPSQQCLIRQPVILNEEFRGPIVLNGPGTRLVAVQPEAVAPGSSVDTSAAWLYTFINVGETRSVSARARSAPAAEGDDVALEMVVIPVGREEAAQWLAERTASSDDAADLDGWQRRAATATAPSVPSRWFLRAATGPVRPGGPPGAGAHSLVEFIYPTEWDPVLNTDTFLCPAAFETRNCGSEFGAQATWSANGRSALVSASFAEITLEEMEEWPCSLKQRTTLQIEQPLFRVREFKSEVEVPVNGVRFVGMRKSRAAFGVVEESDRECELLFLRVHGRPQVIAPDARRSPPVIEAHAVTFSVSSAMAVRLSHERDESQRVGALWNGRSPDDARIIQVFAGAVCLGGALQTSDIMETICPSEVGAVGDDFALTAFDTESHGGVLTLRPRVVNGAVECKILLQWESAPRSHPTIEDFQKFALEKTGAFPTPKFFQEEVAVDGADVPLDGNWHIVRFKECSAPEGAAEHGRWHAAVVRLMKRG